MLHGHLTSQEPLLEFDLVFPQIVPETGQVPPRLRAKSAREGRRKVRHAMEMFFQRLPFLGWFAFESVCVELGHGHQPMDDRRYVSDLLPPLQAKPQPVNPPGGTPI